MNVQIHPGDTLQSCMARLLNSTDSREPLAMYLSQILDRFGVTSGGGGGSAALQLLDSTSSISLRLSVNATGDLMVTNLMGGPNAGKSANLTYGHWA